MTDLFTQFRTISDPDHFIIGSSLLAGKCCILIGQCEVIISRKKTKCSVDIFIIGDGLFVTCTLCKHEFEIKFEFILNLLEFLLN